ncbi:MAG: hypothetical protein BWZ07_02537 [Alphaproteobacteria bacterium ADurb.BinA280]|jgi:hypothetical protein|nr:MAG: hypothetical protein BWZ07_02537 [Alphaproteobacteria bacterium ADurb.BinA280]
MEGAEVGGDAALPEEVFKCYRPPAPSIRLATC